MRLLTGTTGLLVLLALCAAAPARADEYGYLYAINSAGLNVIGDLKMLRLGDAVCADLADGLSVYDAVEALTGDGSPFTVFQAGEIIYASVDQLCPAYKRRVIAEVRGTDSII